jgi:hypothetical protein
MSFGEWLSVCMGILAVTAAAIAINANRKAKKWALVALDSEGRALDAWERVNNLRREDGQ